MAHPLDHRQAPPHPSRGTGPTGLFLGTAHSLPTSTESVAAQARMDDARLPLPLPLSRGLHHAALHRRTLLGGMATMLLAQCTPSNPEGDGFFSTSPFPRGARGAENGDKTNGGAAAPGVRDPDDTQQDTQVPAAHGASGHGNQGAYSRVPVRDRRVWHPSWGKGPVLTFDDGPHPTVTPAVLAALAARDLVAVFFVVGRMVQAHPGPLLAAHAAGHRIGNHSFAHPDLTRISSDRAAEEIGRTQEIVAGLIGQAPVLFRPPYGARNAQVDGIVGSYGLTTWMWDIDTRDYQRPGAATVAARVTAARSGQVVLLHDIHAPTAAAIARL